MQVFGGGGVSSNGGVPGEPGKSGGLFGGGQKVGFAVNKADNINPEAQDCYFYYYSTCSKGDQCKFRHCSAALGTEEVCDLWLKNQNCRRQICAFRHSVPERQRAAIPCFWESQGIGCLKPHCPFLHTKPRPQPPSAMDRLGLFKKKEFEGLKVKTLDEIRQEKQTGASVTTSTFSHATNHSYNLTYTPSHPPPSSSQTSFRLTSVLKTTGLAGGGGKKKPQQLQLKAHATKTTTTSMAKSNAISQPITTNSAHVSKPFAVQSTEPAKPTPPEPRLKLGRVTTSVSESSKNLFNLQNNLSSVFSPNFDSKAVVKKSQNEVKLAVSIGSGEGRGEGRGVGEKGGSRKAVISAITWGDEEEEEGEEEEGEGEVTETMESKKGPRLVRFQPPATSELIPVAKKMKLTTSSSSSLPPGISARLGPPPLPLPKASSSPIKLDSSSEDQGDASIKVGVAIGGRGQSEGGGVSDFHVKSLEEIRAEKKRRRETRQVEEQTVNEKTHADSEAVSNVAVKPGVTKEDTTESASEPVTAVIKSQVRSKEKKIFRVKKRTSVPVEEGKEGVGSGDIEEGSEEGRGEGGEERESSEKNDVGEVSSTEKTVAPVTKRRKLSRTPLSAVQATPTSDTPTITSSEFQPKKAPVEGQLGPNQTEKDKTKATIAPLAGTPAADVTNALAENETESDQQTEEVEDKTSTVKDEEEGRKEGERDATGQRKMSVSEMKAQIQSELRDRRISEGLSLEQLDTELAQWEEELGEIGEEGEVGGVDDEGLLDSKTDDDLMLEIAEFL